MRSGRTGVLLLLAAITMLFTALTSAMVVRRGLGTDWGDGIPFPATLWVSTAALALSAATVQRWNRAAVACGLIFLVSQGAAWKELVGAGVFAATSPGAAFFYVFTATHAVHLAGGVGALLLAPPREARLYWHYLTALWIYLVALFQWGR